MVSIQETAREVSRLAPQVMARVKGAFMPGEDLTAQQMIMILTLKELGKVKVTGISRRMGVSPPTTTGLIDRLQRKGYVRRLRDERDRRVVLVELTPRGASFVVKIRDSIQKRWMKVVVYLSESERDLYVRLLKKIVEGLTRDANAQSDEKE